VGAKAIEKTQGGDAVNAAGAVCFDAGLLQRYGGRGPRYTSYPTAPTFHERFGAQDYARHAAASNATPAIPLSLYLHIPFCRSLCYYCGCTKIVTRNAERVQGYISRLHAEIALQGALFDRSRVVEQLHLGGGSPTYLSQAQLSALLRALGEHFRLTDSPAREYSIEVDPRTVTPEDIDGLAALGFNRLSLGVQDFEPAVQRAVNRLQSAEATLALIERARAAGFGSVSVDLIYGLPRQHTRSFDRTLERLLQARPDRIAVYSYAHLPAAFKSQRLIREDELPSAGEKLELLRHTVEKLTGSAYVYVGMDHFALPGDELVQAQRRGELQRNFQGYSTHARSDLIGLGMSAIGKVGECHAQNERHSHGYSALLADGKLPVVRGIELDDDDRLRADVIQQLMCHGRVRFAEVEARHGIAFTSYFGRQLTRLEELERDGLIDITTEAIEVTSRGRLLVRAVAMAFDRYLEPDVARYSRLI
jgi:oxygen-independent coproporphyrinogen III oxidase